MTCNSQVYEADADCPYYRPPKLPASESYFFKQEKLWFALSDDAKAVLGEAYRQNGRPFPWNEGAVLDSDELARMEPVWPDHLIEACRKLNVKLSIDDWLNILDVGVDDGHRPTFERLDVEFLRDAGRVLRPDSIVSFVRTAGISTGYFVFGDSIPSRHILANNDETVCPVTPDWLVETNTPVEQIHPRLVKDLGLTANLIIGPKLRKDTEDLSNMGVDGFFFRHGCLGPWPHVREVIEWIQPYLNSGLPKASGNIGSRSSFVLCPADEDVCASASILKCLADNNLSILGMIHLTEDVPDWKWTWKSGGSNWVVLGSGPALEIHSIVLKGSDHPRVEEFLSFVFGEGKAAPLGMLSTSSDRFLSARATQTAVEIQKRTERSGLPMESFDTPFGRELLKRLGMEIWMEPWKSPEGDIAELPPASLDFDDDEKRNLQHYLKCWLKTQLGLAYSQLLTWGYSLDVRPKQLSDFKEGWNWPPDRLPAIPLPDQSLRNEILELDARISTLQAESSALRESAWSKPLALKNHQRAFLALNTPEEDPGWIDDIPFPVASIVWQAHTSPTNREKLDLLIKLFEGLASFHASILMSAALADSRLCDELRTILADLKDKGCDIRRATFGTWVQIYERLAKLYRSRLNSQANLSSKFEWLGSSPGEQTAIVARLSSKEITSILQRSNNLRNRVSGHGPVITEPAAEPHVLELRELLGSWRRAVGVIWQEVRLIQPTSQMIRRSGAFHLEARVITGVRQPFPLEKMALVEAPDADWLHLHHVGCSRTLPLVPFIRVSDPPPGSQVACYFFNRLEPDGAHFVSYHYGDSPERTFSSDPTEILNAMVSRQLMG